MGEYFAEQHHIDATSKEKKRRMNNFFRIFVPEIFALSTNSPIHDNRITDWKSVRSSMNTYNPSKRVNPNIKPPQYLSKKDIERGYLPRFEHEEEFEQKRKKSRYYDVSPFTQKDKETGKYKSTLEIRLLDSHPYIPLTVSYGALFQSLAKKLEKISQVPKISIEHNRKEAIKSGISSKFHIKRKMKRYFHYKNLSNSSSIEVIKSLLSWLEPEIKELGYSEQLKPLKRFLKHRKNLADWQIHLFSQKKDQFHSEMIEATMENYDKPPLPGNKIKFNFVDKEKGKKDIEWDKDIKKACDKLEREIESSYTLNFKKLSNALLALHETKPNMKEKKRERWIKKLCKKYKEDNLYNSLLLLETLFRFEETEKSLYRDEAERIMIQIEEDLLEKNELWISAYALSVMSRVGGKQLNKKKYADKITDKIKKDTPSWVKAYIVEYFTISGKDASKEFSNLKKSLKNDHWECKQTDDIKATSIIYNRLSNIGYKNEKVVRWLKGRLREQLGDSIDDIQKFSLNLRALSREATR